MRKKWTEMTANNSGGSTIGLEPGASMPVLQSSSYPYSSF